MKKLLIPLALIATPAAAVDRTLSITDFDSIRVDGGYAVEVATGRAPSRKLSGSEQAIERVDIRVESRRLVVRPSASNWGGYPGAEPGTVTIRLTTPGLLIAGTTGASSLVVDKMRGTALRVAVEGSGAVTIGAIEADRLDIGVSGAGTLRVAGKGAQVSAVLRGSGGIDASKLVAADATVGLDGTGDLTIGASRSANVNATGGGRVTVLGKPACTVKNQGTATVVCG